jgi:ribosomal protein L3 glutamine methyltransferase
MDTDAIATALRAARSCEDWVETLARCFESAGLVFGHGTDNARDEAFWLIRHLQRWSEEAWGRTPDTGLVPDLVALSERRIRERIPLAYLLGEAWFAGLPFKVNEHVLIPRSPLAELIENGFAPWCALQAGDVVLDVGTGSGCIAVATAVHCPGVGVDATELSAEALAVAAENVSRHGVAERVSLVKADLFPPFAKRYRVIISNPPYVPQAELAMLPPEYAHEPAAALAAGPTGIEAAVRLLRGARSRLTADGLLIVEVGNAADELMAAFPRLPALWLEFEHGGEGVFAVSAEDLERSGF